MSSVKNRKHMLRRRIASTLAALVCAVMTFALCTVVARAAGEGNTLTVGIADEANLADITSNEPLVADVYKVADATYDAANDTYSYTMTGVFADLQGSLDAAMAGNSDWKVLYDSAAVLAKDATPTVTGRVIAGTGASSISLPEDGMYLVLARGKSHAAGTNVAEGTKSRYVFQASMVAMPTKYDKDGQMSGPIGTDPSYGEWHTEATILLKYSKSDIPTPPTPTPPKPSKPSRVVNTGQEDRLMPLYVIMGVSGALFLVLAIDGIRKRRSQGKES